MPALLEALRESNTRRNLQVRKNYEEAVANKLSQVINPPEFSTDRIPTLERGIYQNSTPMLNARFAYAGSWVNAYLAHTWLGIREMEQVWDDVEVLEQIRIRRENWEESPPASAPLNRISLFGIYREQCEEIYLLWDIEDSVEPRVYSYAGNYEEQFTSLADFVLYCAR